MNSEVIIECKKCQKCGFLQHSSHIRCIKCKHEAFDKVKAVGNAALLTYTILKAPPAEFRDRTQYALGILEFQNHVKVLGQLAPDEQLKIGLKMKPTRKKICSNLDGKEIHEFIFVPI
ncbi:MAG: hypothetical protein EAX91_14490 [Candidatus Lokiarchaeota archaeon]|nr:hypothetical protein [Candidatus Lokiarchaeota archaeon]